MNTAIDQSEDFSEQHQELVPPKNFGPSPSFNIICTMLFDQLLNITRVKKTNMRAKPYELRAKLLQEFIQRWRTNVGNDIYPIFRLLMPDKDSERPMYGLKEKAIARIIMKMQNIDPASEDGKSLSNWKVGYRNSAGDFPERCYEFLKKREGNRVSSNLTVDEVNNLLDKLSLDTEKQLDTMKTLCQSMNAEEMRWVIKIILRDMHYGLTEKTILGVWHRDAMTLFNVTSNLKRVCWELYDPSNRLSSEQQDVALMSCFQPQLASYKKSSFQEIVKFMPSTFYIEEKMDGERLQLHMDDFGKVFKFFSRKAKDYTYLYGNSLDAKKGSLTKHLKNVFDPRVENCILDGEMVAWDPASETVVPFGSIKTAALNEMNERGLTHPLFLVFDILYLNGVPLVKHKLSERRKTMESVIHNAKSHLELLPFVEAHTEFEIMDNLKRIIESASEGLVVKNPDSPYRVSERNNDWIKHKPEYLEEFGENLEVCIIGGYFGNGSRSKKLSSFLCGLRVDGDDKTRPKFWSFCKVGGGMTTFDYTNIGHSTQGKWHKWDRNNPPTEYMELAGNHHEKEAPDQWIKPEESIIIQIKGAQVILSNQFRTLKTLRFPRFTKIRDDKDYTTSLSYDDFVTLQREIDVKLSEKAKLQSKKTRPAIAFKKRKIIQYIPEKFDQAVDSYLFDGYRFCILSDQIKPRVKKAELEKIVQQHGGQITQEIEISDKFFLISDKVLVKVAGIIGKGFKGSILKPNWILSCVKNGRIVSVEPRHLLHSGSEDLREAKKNVDKFGDSYYEDVSSVDVKELFSHMKISSFQNYFQIRLNVFERSDVPPLSLLFCRYLIYFDRPKLAFNNGLNILENGDTNVVADQDLSLAQNYALAGGARTETDIYHIGVNLIVCSTLDTSRVSKLLTVISKMKQPIRIVDTSWFSQCWKEKTLLDEERFQIII